MSRTLRISCLCFILLLTSPTSAFIQFPHGPGRQRLPVPPGRRQVPEATLPCSPEEGKWWEELRKAGDAVRKTRAGAKEKERFLGLIQSEPQKSFQVPIPDRNITVLTMSEPKYTDEARRKKISGTVRLQVEFKADGRIGDVETVEGLRPDLDLEASEATRRTLFLPAVKDRKFVSSRMPMEMTFHIY